MRPARAILVTGCASGIGLDAARTLHRRGWRVLATCRAPGDAERLAAEGMESFALDQADDESVAAGAAEALRRTGGRLDALFANGAHALPGYVEDVPRDALRAIFEANLFGVHDLTRRLIPALRRSGDGRVVMCSSVLGFTAMPLRGAYVATKFALEGLTDTLRMEMRGQPVRVVLIEPGPITTRIRQNSIPHFERWIDVEGSARRADYARLRDRLYGELTRPDPGELPPAAVTRALIRALEAPRPRARYRVTAPTRAAEAMRRLLPTRLRDRILSR